MARSEGRKKKRESIKTQGQKKNEVSNLREVESTSTRSGKLRLARLGLGHWGEPDRGRGMKGGKERKEGKSGLPDTNPVEAMLSKSLKSFKRDWTDVTAGHKKRKRGGELKCRRMGEEGKKSTSGPKHWRLWIHSTRKSFSVRGALAP